MKNAIANSLFHQHPSAASQKKAGGLLALTALLLCGLALPASAETTINQVAHEQGFTIAPGVSTPIVLKTTADAACDLHGETASDRALRFDANLEGYVKIHVRPEQGTEDTRLQLDCTEMCIRDSYGTNGSVAMLLRVYSAESCLISGGTRKSGVKRSGSV